ncbi:hypothetical protein EBR11_02540 [bacterium]|nr:hypothetical protein [bacterium]
MSDIPPPPPPGDSAPKLKLSKPAGPSFSPPPPPAPIPPPPSGNINIPKPSPLKPAVTAATSPRISPSLEGAPVRGVSTAEAAFDVLTFAASVAPFIILYIELFNKTKG